MSLSLIALALLASGSPLWAELAPGPYRAGFEERVFVDHSRPYHATGEDRARRIPALVWYPAVAEEALERLPFGGYVGTVGREEFESRLGLYGTSLSPEEMETVWSSPTNAYGSATPAAGRFPLLLFGTGMTSPAYLHTVLCEYLATHGYVAVALPTLPFREGETPDFDPRTIDAQMRDMELVVQELHDDPRADIGRIGLVAWSAAGVAQALLQMKNPDVAAVVSLDAGTGYAYGERLLEQSIFFEPRRARAPFFHATDSRESTSRAAKSFRYFDEIVSGPAYLLTLDGMAHSEFTSFGSVIPHAVVERSGSEAIVRRYALLALYVRHFLDEALGSSREAAEFLSVAPTRHGYEGLVLSRKR